MAKASPETGATFYVAEGGVVPDDLPEGVRPVGPGAPAPAAEADEAAEPEAPAEEPDPTPAPPRPVSKPKPSSPVSSAPADGS